MNNWPAALILSAAIELAAPSSMPLIAGTLIGCTIGANLTMFGSLSTVLWLTLLRGRGESVSAAGYARAAVTPTLAGLLAACGVAALSAR
jgi:arsenical pump membrane protein